MASMRSLWSGEQNWFDQYDGLNYVLYWTPAADIPTEAEVKQRIEYLAKHGPTPVAFTFEQQFTLAEMLALVLNKMDEHGWRFRCRRVWSQRADSNR